MTTGVQRFFSFFVERLRLSNPWNYKVPFLISVSYMVMLAGNYSGGLAFIAVLLSLCIIIGVAGVGYLSNDLGDSEKDKLIGKPNVQQELSRANVLLLYTLFLACALLPWLWLPFTRYSAILITSELVLFFAYSFKPLRLKERGVLGVLADALYAHALPAALAAYTFFLFTANDVKLYVWFIALLCIWQFVLGLRNIVFHQLQDAENDVRSGTATFVTKQGVGASEKLVRGLLLLEIATFAAFITNLAGYTWFILPMLLFAFVFIYLREKKFLPNYGFRKLAYIFLDDVYIKWLPVAVLLLLSWISTTYAALLLLHFVVFRSRLKTFLNTTLNKKT